MLTLLVITIIFVIGLIGLYFYTNKKKTEVDKVASYCDSTSKQCPYEMALDGCTLLFDKNTATFSTKDKNGIIISNPSPIKLPLNPPYYYKLRPDDGMMQIYDKDNNMATDLFPILPAMLGGGMGPYKMKPFLRGDKNECTMNIYNKNNKSIEDYMSNALKNLG